MEKDSEKNVVYHTKSFALRYRFCPVPDYGCEPKSALRMNDLITPEFIPGMLMLLNQESTVGTADPGVGKPPEQK